MILSSLICRSSKEEKFFSCRVFFGVVGSMFILSIVIGEKR